MCTALAYHRQSHYFGRNLDVEFTFREQVAITPRRRTFHLKNGKDYQNHYALIGTASVIQDYPLYYEAANEKGLAMAGLNFPGNARYQLPREGMDNIAVSELIPWLLGQAADLAETRSLLTRLNLTDFPFNKDLPNPPLHYMISDAGGSIVVEPRENGLEIFDNPYHVMTNNPPFQYHLWNLPRYRNLSPASTENRFSSQYDLKPYAVGMAAEGLPGDSSSTSRFVRAAFNLTNSACGEDELSCVTQFFHVLDSVSMVKGTVLTEDGKNDITRYSCCINADKGIFYYKTYDNSRITAVHLHHADLNSSDLILFPLRDGQDIRCEN